MTDLKKLCKILNYEFRNEKLLEEALTHPSLSYKQKQKFNYERLEILGDAVLSLIIVEYLLEQHKSEKEGSIAKRRAALVCTKCLAKIARKLDIGSHISMSHGEEKDGGRENDHNLENAVESLIGALYLDGGIEVAKGFILEHWSSLESSFKEAPKDAKSRLQEWTQKVYKALPRYVVLNKTGMAHNPEFHVQVRIKNTPHLEATGKSKQDAERRVAVKMLKYIRENVDGEI